jgi:iron(III) transport system substrate-binding protein
VNARLLAGIAAVIMLAACGASRAALSSPPAPASSAQGQWDATLKSARQEGEVSIIMPPGSAMHSALVDAFEKAYPGISVDAFGAGSSGVVPRVTNERSARKYLWDVYVNGVTDVLTTFIPNQYVEPMEPSLILLEVTDLKNWRGGQMEFLDKDRTLLVAARTLYPTIWVNPNTVKPEQIKSHKDFLDPSWRGKLVIDDPRRSGPGQALLTLWYLSPNLGADFIRAFAKQQPLIMADYQQEANMLGQGRYPVLLGGSDQTLAAMIKNSLPVAVIPPTQLSDPPQVAAGATGVALFNRAPHPNAAKVYLNWLLSKEGQAGFAQVNASVSARSDVPPTGLESWRVPTADAIKTYGPDVLAVRDKVNALAKEVFSA